MGKLRIDRHHRILQFSEGVPADFSVSPPASPFDYQCHAMCFIIPVAGGGRTDISARGHCAVQMTILTVIAIANSVTLAVTIAAAIRRPIGSYIFIAAIALCAFLSSIYQVATGTGMFITNSFTIVLVASILGRIALNIGGRPPD